MFPAMRGFYGRITPRRNEREKGLSRLALEVGGGARRRADRQKDRKVIEIAALSSFFYSNIDVVVFAAGHDAAAGSYVIAFVCILRIISEIFN